MKKAWKGSLCQWLFDRECLPAIYAESVEGKLLSAGLSAENPFPLYMKKRKPLPGGLSAGDAFPLYLKQAWIGSFCQVACRPGMHSRYIEGKHGGEASARWLVGRECLPAIYEESMEGKLLPGGLSAGNAFLPFMKKRRASARCRAGLECLPAIYEEGVEGKLLPGDLSAGNALPLYTKERRGRETSAKFRAGWEGLPAIYE